MQEIRGSTSLAGLIGHPLSHTLSPAMHNAVYKHLDLDWVYLPLEVSDEVGLRRLIAAIRSMNFVGFNVTMPFKQSVLELCDEVAMAASMAGAVNAVHCADGRLVGYNTDGRGLLEALESEAGFVPAGKNVAILGAGGAAGATIVALILARATSVTVVNRDYQRAEDLVERMTPHLGSVRGSAAHISSAEEAIGNADLIVNATPVGMRPDDENLIPAAWIQPGQIVFDMVYGTEQPTALVREARARGAKALDGLGMLVCQAATAVDIWNDSKQIRTPRNVMREAAEKALEARVSGR